MDKSLKSHNRKNFAWWSIKMMNKDVLLVLMSNNFEVSALEIARLYRNRWEIEVFKWINQNLTIK